MENGEDMYWKRVEEREKILKLSILDRLWLLKSITMLINIYIYGKKKKDLRTLNTSMCSKTKWVENGNGSKA